MTKPVTAPVPPQNLEAEETILGAMMLSPGACDAASEELTGEEFYRESHRKIFQAASELHIEGVGVEAITVVDRLELRGHLDEVGGKSRVWELAALTPATSNVRHHCRIIREMHALRGMIRLGSELTRFGYDRPGEVPELIEKAERMVFDLGAHRSRRDFAPVSADVHEAYRRLQELQEKGAAIIGVSSGLRPLDELTSGFQPGQLFVLAARPSMGKSGLALCIAANIVLASRPKPVGLFTMEMSRAEVTTRLLSSEGLVDSMRIRNGALGVDDWNRVTSISARLEQAPLFIEDTPAITMGELRSKARRLKLRQPDLALIVVDYLQLMGGSGDAYERVTENSRAMKALAREIDVPILALSQLSRQVEQRHDKRPILSDLRESGAIEQDADLVAFIYRDEYYNPEDTDQHGMAEVNIAKQRNGPTGTFRLAFVKRFARFSELPPSGLAAGVAVEYPDVSLP